MAQLRRTLTTNLGEQSDKDILDFVEVCKQANLNDSIIIKNCIRYYIANVGLVPPIATVQPMNTPDIKDLISNVVKELVGDLSGKKTGSKKAGGKNTTEVKKKRTYTKRKNVTAGEPQVNENNIDVNKEADANKESGQTGTSTEDIIDKYKAISDKSK